MATFITTGNSTESLTGSAEKRLEVAPNGTLWALLVTGGSPGKAKFFKSTNSGSTWTYASGSDIDLVQYSTVPSFFIDADGYAHVCNVRWDRDPQTVRYSRGTPTTGGGWSWAHLTISPASGRTGTDSDVIAFRSGTGWVAWVSYDLRPGSGATVARVAISSTGALSVTTTQHGPSSGLQTNQFGSLEFNHTGDGRTPAASPHLYFTSGVVGAAGPIRLNRAAYSGGTWTWETPVTLAASVDLTNTTLATTWDGARLMVAYAGLTGAIFVSEWDGVAAPTARNPPALPAGVSGILGISLSHDPITDDVYLTFYDNTDGDVRWSKFSRTTLTWSAWAIAVSKSPTTGRDGKLQNVRHPPRDSVDMIYATGGPTSFNIYYQQLATLPRTPSAATLLLPASGAQSDLASGGTFTWKYNAIGPGDSQQGWVFRRTLSATIDYWNAATQAFQSTLVVNTGNATSASFPAGKWTNGNTYSWSVRVRSATGVDSVFATDRTVVATAAPAVVVDNPSGVVFGESTPLVTWTYTGSDPQRDYQVKIIPEAASIDPNTATTTWDSGITSSATARSARIGATLTDGAAYRAYVRTTSSTGLQSAWSYSSFTIELTPPTGPTITPSVEVDVVTGVPKVRLDILGRSSLLSLEQDTGVSGWASNGNTTVAAQAAASGIFAGLSLTSVAAGTISAITDVGTPPTAPYGEAQPNGPLNFPTVPGVTYTALVSVRAAATTRSARVKIQWYNADDGTGTLLSTSTGTSVNATSVFYQQVSVTATAPAGAVLGRMVIDVLAATAANEIFYTAFPSFHPGSVVGYSPGGYSETETMRVQRSADGGLTWVTIIDRVKPTLAQQATTYDRLMPLGTLVQYRAYTEVDFGLGSIMTSDVSPSGSTTVPSDLWTIRDPADDTVEMKAYVVGYDRGDDESSSVHRPAGREYPIVDTEGVQSATGSLDIYVKQADLAVATNVLRRAVPIVVQSPIGEVFYARFIRRDYTVSASRNRVIKVAYVEVEGAV